ncbi:hypothetical protein F4553_001830 [Allocatelliglobosispora scoriae]|uniref:Uncharacterized protein n=1 Tax=Allocatelliglobosispora scoriae TaxID=643052 RepID=A0A841BNQ2_9ACTN|nr:hypothetical protein [Allocatelliglobosispora scoriae]
MKAQRAALGGHVTFPEPDVIMGGDHVAFP